MMQSKRKSLKLQALEASKKLLMRMWRYSFRFLLKENLFNKVVRAVWILVERNLIPQEVTKNFYSMKEEEAKK